MQKESFMKMYCDQCEQTAHGTGCTEAGVCGKNPDIESLQKILLYGLKGMAAYASHARRLGKTSDKVNAFFEKALFATVTNVNFAMDALLEMVLECGRMNLEVMKLLNDGHVETFGAPAPATVYEGTKSGPGILITGHDMLDLQNLLDQVEGTEVNVYTHGEMLPAHMYPKLREHPNLAGHYGGAWQKQKKEFAAFGGAVLATTNCVLIPPDTYRDRLFTLRETAVPGAKRLTGSDFTEVIEKAKSLGSLPEKKEGESQVGFHHTVILGIADKIVAAVKSGDIKHFFLIGGCDGAKAGRNYFAEVAQSAPRDSVILTLGCGKYRIRDFDYGTTEGGIPRLLDMGQCNDAYGAIQVAVALADAFECGVNDLPLSLVISWFEQKAVVVLLTLLHLGIKGIRIGPAAPAFITPNVMSVLQETFDLKLIGKDAKADLQEMLAG